MIRKIIIVVLTLGAVASGVAFATSWLPDHTPVPKRKAGWTYHCERAGLGWSASFREGDFIFINSRWGSSGPSFNAIIDNDVFEWKYHSGVSASVFTIRFPLLLMFSLLVAYPACAFIRGPIHRYRRRKRGLCVGCGYDLRGSPGRCPECGSTEP